MAREILVRFGTQNLKKAREAAKAIAKSVRESAKGIKDVAARKLVIQEAKAQAFENSAALNAERDRQRGDAGSLRARKRARFNDGRPAGMSDPDAAKAEFEKLSGGVQAALGFAAVPFVGQIGAAVWGTFVQPYLEREFAAIDRAKIAPLLARLDRLEADNFARQLKENAQVQDRVAGEAAKLDRVRESQRWAKVDELRRVERL